MAKVIAVANQKGGVGYEKLHIMQRSNKFVRNAQENIKDKTRGIKQKEGKKDL